MKQPTILTYNPIALVQKLWNHCNILRDDGLSHGDYVEQLTFLLFLKMADKQARPPFNKPAPIEGLRPWIPYSVGSRANGRNRHGAANSFADFQTRSVCSNGIAPQRAVWKG